MKNKRKSKFQAGDIVSNQNMDEEPTLRIVAVLTECYDVELLHIDGSKRRLKMDKYWVEMDGVVVRRQSGLDLILEDL